MIINGTDIANQIELEVADHLKTFKGRHPSLAIVQVGENPASQVYIKRKIAACQRVGIKAELFHFEEKIREEILIDEITKLSSSPFVDGILVQLPLPPFIDVKRVMLTIDPDKDIDGFHPMNLGKLTLEDESGFVPCTPLGIHALLQKSNIDLAGKHVVIMGRSLTVGRPLALLLMQRKREYNATVTVVHSKSAHLPALCRSGDIVIAAMGQPQFVTQDMISPGAVVIDVGINRLSDPSHPQGGRLVGDVDFAGVRPKCLAITPVPGGVGPMTIAMLLKNVVRAREKRTR